MLCLASWAYCTYQRGARLIVPESRSDMPGTTPASRPAVAAPREKARRPTSQPARKDGRTSQGRSREAEHTGVTT